MECKIISKERLLNIKKPALNTEKAKIRQDKIKNLGASPSAELLALLTSIMEEVKKKHVELINDMEERTAKDFKDIGKMVSFEVARAELNGGILSLDYTLGIFDKYLKKNSEVKQEHSQAKIALARKNIIKLETPNNWAEVKQFITAREYLTYKEAVILSRCKALKSFMLKAELQELDHVGNRLLSYELINLAGTDSVTCKVMNERQLIVNYILYTKELDYLKNIERLNKDKLAGV